MIEEIYSYFLSTPSLSQDGTKILNKIMAQNVLECVSASPKPRYSQILIPPGTELGILWKNLRGEGNVVMELQKLSRPTIEQIHVLAKIRFGYTLVAINSIDITHLDALDMEIILAETKNIKRIFLFKHLDEAEVSQSEEDENLSGEMLVREELFDKTSYSGRSLQIFNANFKVLPSPRGVTKISCGLRHVMLLTSCGSVYTFGSGEGGRLGHGDEVDRYYATRVKYLDHCFIGDIDCGRDHSIVLTDSGIALSFGWGEGGRLGLGQEVDKVLQPTPMAPSPTSPPDLRFTRVACGREHTLLVSTLGLVYACGVQCCITNGNPSEKIHLHPKYISVASEFVVSVAAGEAHSMLLTKTGQVYTWGYGSSGALGHGNEETVNVPTLVKALRGYQVKEISCGYWHSACLTNEGALWVWGDGDAGQVGRTQNERELSPKLAFDDTVDRTLQGQIHISKLWCGPNSTFIQTKTREQLYVFGDFDSNHNNTREERQVLQVPRLIAEVASSTFMQVGSGGSHTVLNLLHQDEDKNSDLDKCIKITCTDSRL